MTGRAGASTASYTSDSGRKAERCGYLLTAS